MQRFDWPILMRAGLAGLRLRPAEFWELTPAEFGLLLGADPGRAPLTRAGLEALARAFPDNGDENDG